MQSISLTNRNFWIAQLGGWAIFALGNGTIQAIGGLPLPLLLLNSFIGSSAGLLVTSIFRHWARRIEWDTWQLTPLLFFIGVMSFCLSALWDLAASVMFVFLGSPWSFTIVDFFSNLFNGFLIFLIWLLIYFFFQYFIRFRLAELERWRLAAVHQATQLQALESQLNPHFLFNTLNNIRALVSENPDRARLMLTHFSGLMRYSLHHAQQRTVRLADEIEVVGWYLALMKVHYEHRLHYQIESELSQADWPIPPMSIQTLVENAIKHGISQQPAGGQVDLQIQQVANQLLVAVRNTGVIRETTSDSGTGLIRLRERLKLLYEDSASLTVKEKPPYVVAELRIPAQPASDRDPISSISA